MTPPTPRFLGHIAAITISALLVGLGTAGCVVVSSDQNGRPWTEASVKRQVERSAPLEESTPVSIIARNGSIKVTTDGVGEARITAHVRTTTEARADQVQVTAERDASGALVIQASPPEGGWEGAEGVSMVVQLPGPADLTASSSNGAIRASGVGNVVASTSNASIVIEAAGKVKARSSNGSIQVADARGPVDVATSNGSIKISIAGEGKAPVRAITSNSSISVAVPESFPGAFEAATSNARVSMNVGGRSALMRGSGSAELRLSDGPTSELRTSNGSITVKSR